MKKRLIEDEKVNDYQLMIIIIGALASCSCAQFSIKDSWQSYKLKVLVASLGRGLCMLYGMTKCMKGHVLRLWLTKHTYGMDTIVLTNLVKLTRLVQFLREM